MLTFDWSTHARFRKGGKKRRKILINIALAFIVVVILLGCCIYHSLSKGGEKTCEDILLRDLESQIREKKFRERNMQAVGTRFV